MPSSATNLLSELTSSPDYFARVSEVVLAIASASDAASVVELLQRAADRIGADAAVYVTSIPSSDDDVSIDLLLACDPCWCVDYERHAWYADDPWLAYAQNHAEPTLASDLTGSAGRGHSLEEIAERHGFCSAVIVPAPATLGLARRGMLVIGSRTPGFFESTGLAAVKVVALPLAAELQSWSIAAMRRALLDASGLSGSDLMLLEQERRGLTTKHIAGTTGMSTASVDSRFQRVKAKLGAPTRKAAARLAAEYGLI